MFTDRFGNKTMTVAELIIELQKCPPEAPVFTEGCDCTGNAASVEQYEEASGFIGVMINRDN